ncbi:MAG TPA: TetR/AcrR family transcriptional regulator [Rhizomicrobium sp.]
MTKRAWGAEIQNRQEKFELKRRAVLQSAARIIRRSGFETLSLGDIAEDLHVSKPTIYYYFHNKEEIVRELMDMAVLAFLDPADHPEDYHGAPGLNGAARFERFIRRSVRVTSGDVGACLFVIYPNQLAPDLRRDLDGKGQPIIAAGEKILREGIDDGSIAPCNPAVVYHFLINGLRSVPVLLELRQGRLEELTDSIVAIMAHGTRTLL